MASSGTYSFGLSNGGIMVAAFRRLQLFPTQLTTDHFRAAADELNLAFVEAGNKQVNLWKVELFSIPLINAQATYSIDAKTVLVLDGWISTTQGGATNDRYITPVSRTDYASYSNKSQPGAPTTYWFDRLINPTLTFWPVPDQSGPFTFNAYRAVQMQDANIPGGETPDLPYLWLDWSVASLSHRLARIYKPALEQVRKQDAMEAWTIAATQNTESVNLVLSPPIGNYYRR